MNTRNVNNTIQYTSAIHCSPDQLVADSNPVIISAC